MITSFLRAQRTRIFWVVIVLILLAVGLGNWYKHIYSDPRRVFSAMIENSLQTQSVTKKIRQSDQSQTLEQIVNIQNGKTHVAQGVTNLSQQGLASANVVTESIGTPTTDYVRYRSIETDQKGETGNDLNFEDIIGVWGETTASGETSGELYNETALGVIPFGNLTRDDRTRLTRLVSDLEVYRVEYANVERGTVNGRPTYSYSVKVLPEEYVKYLKEYATAVGLTHLENVNPGQYKDSNPIEFKVQIDVLTRRLAAINYENGREEQFVSYGATTPVNKPTETLSVEELQERIQSVR